MNILLQVLCTLSAIVTLWLIGDKLRIGFAVGILAQVLWALLFISSGQWIMLITPIIYGVMYARGYMKWGRAITDVRYIKVTENKPVDSTKG